MNSVYNVIIRPIVSEKAFKLQGGNKYVFEVASKATKGEIKNAIQKIFDVKVTRVNTLWVKPKPKRLRQALGTTRKWKKAIVSLKEGDTIEVYGEN